MRSALHSWLRSKDIRHRSLARSSGRRCPIRSTPHWFLTCSTPSMRISCFPANEAQRRQIVGLLKRAGLFDQYEEQAHGDSILLSVSTRTVDEREKVETIFREASVADFSYGDENAA